ncbi:MAG: DUF5309 domain-containing protein [Clostridium sp.]|jgi:hypothetical protein|nr:DUF5309 domain-containing protein [Clostridium sp.]
MSQITNVTTETFPQYAGELFTADIEKTPLLSMIGGLNGGVKTTNKEFPTGQLYDYPAPSQPAISENASITAPAPTAVAPTQEKNVVQKFQESVLVTYDLLANSGRLQGINTAGADTPYKPSVLDFQTAYKLKKMARDIEYTLINGVYALGATADDADKTRGILSLITDNAIAAGGALTIGMLKQLYRTMAQGGAQFGNMVALCSADVKQALSDIYSAQGGFGLPQSREVGGVNITEVETDFFKMGVVWDSYMPTGTLAIVDVAALQPVFMDVPDGHGGSKGNFILEELAKNGAAYRYQLFGYLGLDHGPQFLHGKITGITA